MTKSWPCVSFWNCSSYSSSLMALSLKVILVGLLRVSFYSCSDWYSAQDSSGPLFRFLVFFLCDASYSWVFSPQILVTLAFLNTNVCFLDSVRLQVSVWALLAPWTRVASTLSSTEVHLICFPFLRDRDSMLPVCQRLERGFHFMFVQFLVQTFLLSYG